ncbi:MAG TPA: DUF3606 domain-containing protein [Flavitalea sp.]|nr:DUF3606 domain-containing protein [Flavitalea sp.]
MADDLDKTGKGDSARININQPHELTYWAKTLGISEQLLRNAVLATGPVVENVKAYLKKYARKN